MKFKLFSKQGESAINTALSEPIEDQPMKPEDKSKKPANNPYVDGRREWNERYGTHIQSAQNWRMATFMVSGIALVLAAGMVYVGAQSKIVPYVIKVDRLGTAVSVGKPEAVNASTEALVTKSQVARFVVDTRSIINDVPGQRQMIDRAYAMIPAGSKAKSFLDDHFRSTDPFKRGETASVVIKINNVIQSTKNLWEVEWEEQTFGNQNSAPVRTVWRAKMTVISSPPTSEAQILVNPIGVYIDQFSWSQVI